jgi:hypothetical protein
MTPVRIVLAAVLALIGVGCTTHVPPKVCRATQYVDVTFQRFVRLHGDRHAEFCVTNALAQPVWFAGYSLQSPLFKIQLLKDGRWQDSPMGWCGAGLGLRELPSKASTTFTVPVPPHTSEQRMMRVGLTCWPEKHQTKVVASEYWSDPFNVNK